MLTAVKRNSIKYIAILLVPILAIFIYAKEEGITGRTLKNKKGCTCHGEYPEKNLLVIISGPDSLLPRESGLYVVAIFDRLAKGGGVNISASEGELHPISDDLKRVKGELTHTKSKQLSLGVTEFKFYYVAPEYPGEQTIFASGNAVNMNGKKAGDTWNYAQGKKVIIKIK